MPPLRSIDGRENHAEHPRSVRGTGDRGDPMDRCQGRACMVRGGGANRMEFSACQKCTTGKLVPLSDYGPKGVSEVFKAWVCTNPDCGFFIRARKGEVSYGKGIGRK